MLSRGWRGFSKVIETISAEFARRYITTQDAVFIFPKGSVLPELDSGTILQLNMEMSFSPGPVGLSFDPKVPRSMIMTHFIDQLRAASGAACP